MVRKYLVNANNTHEKKKQQFAAYHRKNRGSKTNVVIYPPPPSLHKIKSRAGSGRNDSLIKENIEINKKWLKCRAVK